MIAVVSAVAAALVDAICTNSFVFAWFALIVLSSAVSVMVGSVTPPGSSNLRSLLLMVAPVAIPTILSHICAGTAFVKLLVSIVRGRKERNC